LKRFYIKGFGKISGILPLISVFSQSQESAGFPQIFAKWEFQVLMEGKKIRELKTDIYKIRTKSQ